MADRRSRLLSEIGAYCDLEERARWIPESAQVRGLFFDSVERVLEGAGLLEEYRELCPTRRSSVRFYPVTEYLEHAAIGAALIASPERVHEGLETIGRRNAVAITGSALGRTLLRVLDPDPRRLLEQGALGKRLSCNYGRWYVSFPSERCAVVTMRDEYIWIDSLLIGAARGTFESVGRTVQDEVELWSRFSGRHVLRW